MPCQPRRTAASGWLIAVRIDNAGDDSADLLLIPPGSAIEIFADRGARHIVIRELPFEDFEARVLRLTPERARLVAAHLTKLADRIDMEASA